MNSCTFLKTTKGTTIVEKMQNNATMATAIAEKAAIIASNIIWPLNLSFGLVLVLFMCSFSAGMKSNWILLLEYFFLAVKLSKCVVKDLHISLSLGCEYNS